MKIDKINLDGKKESIEVMDKIFSGKINKTLVNYVRNNNLQILCW